VIDEGPNAWTLTTTILTSGVVDELLHIPDRNSVMHPRLANTGDHRKRGSLRTFARRLPVDSLSGITGCDALLGSPLDAMSNPGPLFFRKNVGFGYDCFKYSTPIARERNPSLV
jgi:hypothetical protein